MFSASYLPNMMNVKEENLACGIISSTPHMPQLRSVFRSNNSTVTMYTREDEKFTIGKNDDIDFAMKRKAIEVG